MATPLWTMFVAVLPPVAAAAALTEPEEVLNRALWKHECATISLDRTLVTSDL